MNRFEMTKFYRFISTGVIFTVLFSYCHAVTTEDNQGRYEMPSKGGPDAVVPGFLINLGPTGARAILKKNSFIVKYIFKSSPASRKLKIDDEIIAVNGKKFSSHTFSGNKSYGIDGPMFDFGMAIEDSEGSNGILKLTIKRNGAVENVSIQLEKLGRFAETFPLNCKKTKVLQKRAESYLLKEFNGFGAQGQAVAILSMLASDDKKVFAKGKTYAKKWMKEPGEFTWSWVLSFQAITLSEYYLLSKDKSVLPLLDKIFKKLKVAQYKAPNIKMFKSQKASDQKIWDQISHGGFGHLPYQKDGTAGPESDRLNCGYGPMQTPTFFAALAMQIMKQCRVKVEQKCVDNALSFIYQGTNASGLVGYGIPPVKHVSSYQNSRNNGNSQRSGCMAMLYKMSPEYEGFHDRMRLHLDNINASYKDMNSLHADPLMGFTWGLAGVLASDDIALKQKVWKYYKAWFNLARCYGSSSYVVLPGRDRSDASYHRGDIRMHTTASIAFIYSFSKPKLQVHGLKIAIPGVNHYALKGTELDAYQLILAKMLGKASKVCQKKADHKNDNTTIGKIFNYINLKTDKENSRLKKLYDNGQWLSLKVELTKAKQIYKGVPSFDEKEELWSAQLIGKEGNLLAKAEKNMNDQLLSKASLDLEELNKLNPSDPYKNPLIQSKTIINNKVQIHINKLNELYENGKWYTLETYLKDNSKSLAGLKEFDNLNTSITKSLNEADGDLMIKSSKLLKERKYNDSDEALSKVGVQSGPWKSLKASLDSEVKECIDECKTLHTQGKWDQLKKQLSIYKKSMSGLKAYDLSAEVWDRDLKSKHGKILIKASQYLDQEKIGSAAKQIKKITGTLSDSIQTAKDAVEYHMTRMAEEQMKLLLEKESEADWYALSKLLSKQSRILAGVPDFDSKVKIWKKEMRTKEIRKILEAGKLFAKLEEAWQRTKSDKTRKSLTTFSKKYNETVYAARAGELIR